MQPTGDRPVVISFRIEHLLGWGATIVLCLVPMYLWFQIHPFATIQGFPAIMLALGRVTGLVGMVMYALNLVYATRIKLLEYWFGGLNRVYIAHHMLGGLALIFLSFHPLFLALRYIKSSLMQAALMLLPNGLLPLSALFNTKADLHPIVLEQWAIFIGFIAFWGMVALLLITFFIHIPYRIWLWTHKLLGVMFFLGGLHVLLITSDTSKNGPLRYYILGMTILGLLAYIYRTIFGRIIVRKFKYSVDQVLVEGGNVTHFIMRPLAKVMPYKPGQFVFIRFLNAQRYGISTEWHPFSISSSPKEQILRLSVKGLGDYTNKLAAVPTGTVAEIEGAYGRFGYSQSKNKQQIWIGGGIGITPFISMAKDLPQGEYQIDLYYAVRTASEVIDWRALYDVAQIHAGKFRVVPFVGDQQGGHLSADYIEKISGPVKGKDIFICGPPSMMKSLRQQFRDKGVPGTHIHSEEFGMA